MVDVLDKGVYTKSVGEGGQKVLQIFQKKIQSPENLRPKCFMAQ